VGEGGRWVRLTNLPPSCADSLEVWEPQSCGTFNVYPGLYTDCFGLLCFKNNRGTSFIGGMVISFDH